MMVIVRHGRTAENAQGRLLGRTDAELDEVGRGHAMAIGHALKPDVVVSSPLSRAMETAQCFGLPIEIDQRWIELDYGDWERRAVGHVSLDEWDLWRSDIDFAPPGGESLRSLGVRVREACEEWSERAAQQTIAIVTHVSPIKAAMCWALGVEDDVSWRMFVAQASMHWVDVAAGSPRLMRFNDVSHLESAP